jgi:hypothetical protein
VLIYRGQRIALSCTKEGLTMNVEELLRIILLILELLFKIISLSE